MTVACVVVPFRNTGDPGRLVMLSALFDALDAQSIRSSLTTVLSLDGGEELPEELSSRADVLVTGEAAGPAAARNRGWRAVDTRFVLFTDSDCVPETEWAERLLEGLEDGRADGAKGTYSGGGRALVQRLAQVEFEERYAALLGHRDDIDMVDTYSACFTRRALESVGGFDESFPVPDHEDVDLSYRMRGMGMRLLFVPRARVGHTHRESWVDYFGLKLSRGFWRAKVLRSYPGRTLSDSYSPVGLRAQIALMLLLPFVLIGTFVFSAVVIVTWLLLFLVSTGGLAMRSMRKDPGTILLVPVFALWRAAALSAGLLAGLVAHTLPDGR